VSVSDVYRAQAPSVTQNTPHQSLGKMKG